MLCNNIVYTIMKLISPLVMAVPSSIPPTAHLMPWIHWRRYLPAGQQCLVMDGGWTLSRRRTASGSDRRPTLLSKAHLCIDECTYSHNIIQLMENSQKNYPSKKFHYTVVPWNLATPQITTTLKSTFQKCGQWDEKYTVYVYIQALPHEWFQG